MPYHQLISELNADTTLFDALSALYPRLVSDKTARKSSLTAAEQHITSRSALPAAVEDRLLAADLLREFEADGVNLPKDMKILLSSLQV